MSNLEEVKARKGKITAIVTRGDKTATQFANHVIAVSPIPEPLMPMAVVVPLPLLAYHMAVIVDRRLVALHVRNPIDNGAHLFIEP